MRKIFLLAMGCIAVSTLVTQSAFAASGRLYSGFSSPSPTYQWNYYGGHSLMKTPSTKMYINTSIDSSMTTNFLNVDLPDDTGDTNVTWWLQVGFTRGYSDFVYYDNPTSYVEWGYVNALTKASQAHAFLKSAQPLNTGWDYWIRWDAPQGAWKVNINNMYTDYFMYGHRSYGKISGLGEVNLAENKNWGNYSNNTYLNSGGTWTDYDSSFKAIPSDTGSTVSGTATNYTVSR